MKVAKVEVRTKHAKRGRSGFCGPDKYVAVTVAEAGVAVPYALNEKRLRKLGVSVEYFGDGYGQHSGPRSMLGRAIAEARAFTAAINEREVAGAEDARIDRVWAE
jgi:hypothetical protein